MNLDDLPPWDEAEDMLPGKKDANLLDSNCSESFFEGNPEDFMAYLDVQEQVDDAVKYETCEDARDLVGECVVSDD